MVVPSRRSGNSRPPSRPGRGAPAAITRASTGGASLAVLLMSGSALAQTALSTAPADPPAASLAEIQSLRGELDIIKAESEQARAKEAARERKIDDLQRRLDAAAGIPPAPPPVTQLTEVAPAQPGEPLLKKIPGDFEISGFTQLDYIQDFDRVDPNWADTLRPSKIPTTPGLFGSNGQALFSVKQTRLAFQANEQIAGQPFYVKVDFDFFGTGVDAGQTTIRLRNAYGQWGPILGGQTNTLFMDLGLFPNVIDYWGPAGMVFLRDPQLRITFLDEPSMKFAMAIEKPGNDVDPGLIRDIAPGVANNLQPNNPVPDLTAQLQGRGNWGHVQVAGILRDVGYDSLAVLDNAPKGNVLGWGVDTSAVIKTWKNDQIMAGVVYGQGIANYMNDGGTDLAPEVTAYNAEGMPTALAARAVPLLGLTFYYDHYWSSKFSTSLGWSETKVENTSFQAPEAFQSGQYASINLLYTPDSHLLFGGELLYGRREDNDGLSGNDLRVQFSFKYSFSSKDFFQ